MTLDEARTIARDPDSVHHDRWFDAATALISTHKKHRHEDDTHASMLLDMFLQRTGG